MPDLADHIARTIDQHHQSVRNRRCECGWRPMFPQSRFGWEGQQHVAHIAQVLAESIQNNVCTLPKNHA